MTKNGARGAGKPQPTKTGGGDAEKESSGAELRAPTGFVADVREKEMPPGAEHKVTPGRTPSRHGKELLASHETPRRLPPTRSLKPLIAGVLLLVTAGGGLYNSGILVAAPLSPWVTGDRGQVEGWVRNTADQPVPNATVAVASADSFTNESGWFSVGSVETGRQVIVVDAPGYRQLRFVTMISGGNPIRYSFVLTPGNGTETRDDFPNQANGFYMCGGISLLFAAITLAGSLLAFQRRKFAVATAGAIMGIALLFPIGMLTSGAALVLLLFSRGEFK